MTKSYLIRGLLLAALGLFSALYLVVSLTRGSAINGLDDVLLACRDAACCFESADTSTELNLGFTTPLSKMYAEPPFCQRGLIGQDGRLSLAGNEYESAQLVLVAQHTMQDISVDVLPFQRADAPQEQGDLQVEIRVVGYVSQTKPKVAGNRVGWQPDPLLPNQPVDLSEGRPQAYLLTVKSSVDTLPGLYAGIVEVRQQGRLLAQRKLLVDVWSFDLPAKSRFKSASFPGYAITEKLWPVELGFPPPSNDMKMSRFLELAALGFRQRLPPLGFIANGLESEDKYSEPSTRIGFPLYREKNRAYVFDRRQADNLIEYLKANNANHFFIGFTADIYKEPGIAIARERTLLRYLRDYHAYLKEKDLLDQAYIYNIDEPWGESVEHAQAIYRLIKQHFGDDLRVMQNTNQNNARIVGELIGHFDVLDINLGFFPINDIERYRQRYPEELKEIWWNLNLWPDSRPNLFLEYPLIDARILGPMSYKYRIQGFEYWDLAAIYSIENYYPLSDDSLKADWQVGENSLDGLLVYPNVHYGFFSSLRLESFRDGMEDQEYLFILESLDPEHPLLNVPIVQALNDYQTDANIYIEYRRQLARAIEQLSARTAGAR